MSTGMEARTYGSVLHLVLDAPKRRHALTRPMLAALITALTDLPEEITGVVLRGSGNAFSAGADFAELTGTSADLAYDDEVTRVRTAILECPRVVVAAIEGPCMGAAADLALACDLRVLAEGGYLQIPAVRLGLLYNPEALEQHARTYPTDVVRRLFLLGERLDAHAARQAGLASVVVPAGQSAERATNILASISPSETQAIAATKEFLRATAAGSIDRDRWQQRRIELLDSPSRRVAIQAAHARHVEDRSSTSHPAAKPYETKDAR